MNRHFVLATVIAAAFGCDQQRQQTEVFRPAKAAELRYPSYITPYDIMTHEDEFYYHHLSKLTRGGDVAEWPLVKSLVNVGADLIDADMLARMANRNLNITDQSRAKAISQMVDDCADILSVTPPPVYIEGSPFPNAYVTGIGHPHVLVLTSGILELYSETPDELRFIIGHELGHIKAQHLRTLLVGRLVITPLMTRLSQMNSETVTGLVAGTAGAGLFGTLMHWYREAEYSADRAGLICVGGRIEVAQQALIRLLHQTRQSNQLMNDQEPYFDGDLLKQDQVNLRHRPMVKLFSFVHQFGASHPFVADRCVQVRQWGMSDDYKRLLNRPARRPLQIKVLELEVTQIPPTDTYVPLVDSGMTDALVEISYDGKCHTTRHENEVTTVRLTRMNCRFDYIDNAGLIVDLYDYNLVLPNRLVASGRLPIVHNEPGEYVVEGTLSADIAGPSALTVLPKVRLTYRIE